MRAILVTPHVFSYHGIDATHNNIAMNNTAGMPRSGDTQKSMSPPITIQVLERAMLLLDILAKHSEPVALKDLAAATGLHASTTHRILNDLVVGRYVERV